MWGMFCLAEGCALQAVMHHKSFFYVYNLEHKTQKRALFCFPTAVVEAALVCKEQ